MHSDESFDAIVIGSGFGGAVAACRLVQAGFRTCLLERGRRFASTDFPDIDATTGLVPDLRRLAWRSDRGIWELRRAGDVDVVQAAGYGGGSLIYANVHLRPPEDVFARGWPAGYTRAALDPYYDLVAHMLGVRSASGLGPETFGKTDAFVCAARGLGRERDTFTAPVAVRGGAGGCVGCGGCNVGCRHGAKNTLDRTYLAVAEREADVGGRPLIDARTSCEALLLRPSHEFGRDGYVVDYVDHLRGGTRHAVSAPRVFVCAGTINTIELLLRSRRSLESLSDRVGQRVFTNCDQLGVVFDARERHEPTRGPVITTGLVHRDEDGTRIILQDGGFPYGLRAIYATFRARALLGRNRHLDAHAPRAARRPRRRPGSILGAAKGDSPLAFDRAFRVAAELGAYRQAVPAQVTSVLRSLRDAVAGDARDHVAGIVERTLGKLADGHTTRTILGPALRRFMGLSDEAILRAALAAIEEHFSLREPLSAVAAAVTSALSLEPTLDDPQAFVARGAVLLAMAGDPEPSRSTLDASGRLAIDVPPATRRRCEQAERLMRDFAAAYGGELRMAPGWSLSQQVLSVHLHGGCAMSDKASEGVTDAFGEVRGCPGLFVLDASALPASVGVNPASTIAAVAERNIEHHVRRWLRDPSWRAPEWRTACDSGSERAAELDPAPLRHGAPSVPIRAAPIGLVLRERMTGFAGASGDDEGGPAGYERAEHAGRNAGQTISLELEGRIEDLDRFLEDEPVMSLSGILGVALDGSDEERAVPVQGALRFGPLGPRDREWVWTYDLASRTDASRVVLVGRKRFSSEADLDLWRAAITLFADIAVGSRNLSGVFRVSVEDCLGVLMPSLRVTGTDDPARVAWALARFGSFLARRIWSLRGAGPAVDPVLRAIAGYQAAPPLWSVA
jgi:choline dehydrogenase-like flavoprotein